MTKQVQRRRGTSTQHTSFTGAEGEISVNTTNKSVHVHDGVTAGGFEAARADLANVSDANLNNALSGNTLASLTITSADINGGTIDGTTIGGTSPAIGTFTQATVTGDLTIADKIVHSGDTNTAISFPAADTVTVETSGSERLRIDSSGNVGIGATPFYRLHVADATLTSTTAGSNIAARLQSNGAGADVNLQFSDGVSNASQIGMVGGSVYVRTAGSERMRLDASGNVGIGTSSPAQELEIAGTEPNIRLNSGGTPSALYGFEITNGTAVDAYLRTRGSTGETQLGSGRSAGWGGHLTFYTDTSERMRITASGNVGIGTSSVSSVFGKTVKVFSSGNGGTLDVGGSNVNARLFGSEGLSIAGFGTSTNHPFILFTNDTERLRVDASGNLLINTTSSGGSKLRISGLPTSSAGLSAGDVWNDGGTLKIA